MKKYALILSGILCLALIFSACGQEIDETQVIENNATARVTAGDDVFEISGQTVTMNGMTLADNIGANEEKIVVLGGKVYFNTDEGTKYIIVKNGKIKKFGNGKIIYAKGSWVYYENIGLYMVNVADGKQGLLHETALEFKEETDEKIIFTDGTVDYSLEFNADTLTQEE